MISTTMTTMPAEISSKSTSTSTTANEQQQQSSEPTTTSTTTNKFDYLSASVSKNVGNASLLPTMLSSSTRPSRGGGEKQSSNGGVFPGQAARARSFVSLNGTCESSESSSLPAIADPDALVMILNNNNNTNTDEHEDNSNLSSFYHHPRHLLLQPPHRHHHHHHQQRATSSADYAPYTPHLAALFILVLVCLNSVFVFYDCLCLHRLTSDRIPLWAALAHSIFIIW